MKPRQVLLARSIRQVAVLNTGEPRLDPIMRIKERYRFMKAPEKFEEMFSSVFSFQEGVFMVGDRKVAVTSLQFAPNVIVADVRSSTEDGDLFLNDYIDLANSRHAEAITEIGPPYYVSHIEFTMEKAPELPQQFRYAAQTIDGFLADYGLKVPKFDFWTASINADPKGLGVLAPTTFAIERRTGFPFDAKVFFSQAPLRTKDHLAVLEKLDTILH